MENSKKNKIWASVDADDDQKDYRAFTDFIIGDTENKKNAFCSDIMLRGDDYLNEIEEKKRRHSEEVEPMIEYIISKTKKYSPEVLREYSFNDVLDIYNTVKYENRSWFLKFIEFLNVS